MDALPSLPLMQAIPALLGLPLLPLSFTFLGLALLYPRTALTTEQRFSILLPAEEKERVTVPPSGIRPGSHTSRHTTVPSTIGTGFGSAGLAIVLPAVTAALAFGAGAVCQLAVIARQKEGGNGLVRSAGLLNTLGVFFAGLAPIVLLTRGSLNHVFPTCATLQPLQRASLHLRTVEPYTRQKRSSYRIGLLTITLFVACLYTLLTTVLAPTLPIPTSALALGPGIESVVLLFPLPSILHLSPHRPVLVLLLLAHFFGLVSRASPLALTFEPSGTMLAAALQIAGSACTLLWASLLLLCTSVLAATPQRPAGPVPGLYPTAGTHLAHLQASLDRAATPLGIPVPLRPSSPRPSTRASVIDISAQSRASFETLSSQGPKDADLPGYTSDPAPAELNDPTALLTAALLRTLEATPSQASAYESVRSTLPQDFTLTLQGSPLQYRTSFLPSLSSSQQQTPSRPRTAGSAVQSLRRTISRLVGTSPSRPHTAPHPTASADPDCSSVPNSRLTPPQTFGFSAPATLEAGEGNWLEELDASPTARLGRREEKKAGVRVEVETETESEE
ncbi:hypothetical protein DACRYDRAFT_116415 [Dacryopinax primogenitus]|uniref:Uncharacterized protein n=1 Tax=Dacryopinax primogenitus (strain DJM 731) TaxID=1858805 RepID=M5FVZ5_DACPD|nr:uncharacterized protein DACRYDRAFT_116415 [Dacryopinax primogenitus]EJU02031.1 hypothetical protein DACRYDRAFT_116415 [Dacryopinax primogenitus]